MPQPQLPNSTIRAAHVYSPRAVPSALLLLVVFDFEGREEPATEQPRAWQPLMSKEVCLQSSRSREKLATTATGSCAKKKLSTYSLSHSSYRRRRWRPFHARRGLLRLPPAAARWCAHQPWGAWDTPRGSRVVAVGGGARPWARRGREHRLCDFPKIAKGGIV